MKRKSLILMVIGVILLSIIVACSTLENSQDDLSEMFEENQSGLEENDLNVAEVMADFPHYSSVEHLTINATDVIRGEVLDERTEWINTWIPPQSEYEETGGELGELYLIYTIFKIKVLEVFEGEAEVGSIIEVKQIGGQVDDTLFINADEVDIQLGYDLVLFLESFEGLPASLINPTQSVYYFPNINDNTRSDNLSIELESVSPKNDLILTLADLLYIYESGN